MANYNWRKILFHFHCTIVMEQLVIGSVIIAKLTPFWFSRDFLKTHMFESTFFFTID